MSAIADPLTGAIVVTGGKVGVLGGTSVSAPVFSGIWALADQKAGKSLGQAAPLLGRLDSTAMKDIVPVNSPNNVTGTIYNKAGDFYYDAVYLSGAYPSTTMFVSALETDSYGNWNVYSFETDTSLVATKGWDNVTGWGVPKGSHFIDAVAAMK